MPSAPTRPRLGLRSPRVGSRRGLLPAILIIAGIVLLGTAIVAGVGVVQMSSSSHLAPGMRLAIVSDTAAAAAADGAGVEAEAAAYLASQPTAVWLVPEDEPIGEVGAQVDALLAQARDQDAVLTLVVYGLPERDCGNFSSGGLDVGDYALWTTEIGDALRGADGARAIVIVEPDSLALAPECGNMADRAPQLQTAVQNLAAPTAWLYLDGGHSNWLPAEQMAELIRQVDVSDAVRGFATNTSNHNDLAAEFAYARGVSALLGGMHAVIDSSRNGAGSNGEWCNASGRLVGEVGGTIGDDVVDLNLWIKPPGESDGLCNGGPAAGVWWPEAAVELTRGARG